MQVDLLPRLQREAHFGIGELTAPTLVLHSVGDRMNSFEHGRHLAASIRDARLVALESENHILLEDEPAWPAFLAEVRAFLGHGAPATATAVPPPTDWDLSAREEQILRDR